MQEKENEKYIEDKKYIINTLNNMKIEDKDEFMKAVSNVIVEDNRKIKKYEDIILAMNQKSISRQTLVDFLISSVDDEQKPIWTEEHIEEMLDNFVVRWK